jgi:hypothetical protein
MFYLKKKCRLCNGKLNKVIEFSRTPLANNLLSNKKSSLKANFYKLELYKCLKCYHVQLGHIVKKELIFNKYFYRSGVSIIFKNHFREYADEIDKLLKNRNNGKVVIEIGSNDGTLLDYFQKLKYKTIGIDPAKNLKKINSKKHLIFNEYFEKKTVDKILKKYSKIDLITANNVFAHIDEFKKLIVNCKKLMNEETLLCFEVSYLLDVINKNLFDTIYHEHLDYHHIYPLEIFFQKLKMKIIDVKRVPTHGGSIRVYVKKNYNFKQSKNVKNIIKLENKFGLNKSSNEIFEKFKIRIKKLQSKLNKIIKKSKIPIVGYGVPAKCVTLLFQLKIDPRKIMFLIDDNNLKQNKYLPGTDLKIFRSSKLDSLKKGILMILAWNFSHSIIRKLRKKYQNKFTYIVPLPNLKTFK